MAVISLDRSEYWVALVGLAVIRAELGKSRNWLNFFDLANMGSTLKEPSMISWSSS